MARRLFDPKMSIFMLSSNHATNALGQPVAVQRCGQAVHSLLLHCTLQKAYANVKKGLYLKQELTSSARCLFSGQCGNSKQVFLLMWICGQPKS